MRSGCHHSRLPDSLTSASRWLWKSFLPALAFFSLQPSEGMFSRFTMMIRFLLRPRRVHRWQIWASLATSSCSFRKILWPIIARIKCHPRGEYRSFAQNYTVSQFWEQSRVVSRIAEHLTTDHYCNFRVSYLDHGCWRILSAALVTINDFWTSYIFANKNKE